MLAQSEPTHRRFPLAPVASLLIAALLPLLASTASANVHLAGIFSDHMVLQAGATVPVWGIAEPGETVTITLLPDAPHHATAASESAATETSDEKSAVASPTATQTAVADTDGRFRAELTSLAVSDQPLVLNAAAASGSDAVHDVLVGEVWVCSGQSNMELSLKGVENGREIAKTTNDSLLRLCQVGKTATTQPVTDRHMVWSVTNPISAVKFSAVGLFFGQHLRKSLNCPVGLIESAVAGTTCEAWTPLNALQSAPALKPYLDQLSGAVKAATTRPKSFDAGAPTSLYNGMISPLVPFAIKGVVWYQGESNVEKSQLYRTLFPAMITAWRKNWGEGDFPFIFVQLPGFQKQLAEPDQSPWAMMREAQLSALFLPNTYFAVTIDLSMPSQILHPKIKKPVGERLAMQAEQHVYHLNVVADGPKLQKTQYDGNTVHITFTNTGGQLKIMPNSTTAHPAPTTESDESADTTQPDVDSSSAPKLEGFTMAGVDHNKFFNADATIDGDTVVLHCPQVDKPTAVRYGWAENPRVNLYNAAGQPAAPFRTDRYPQ